MARQNRSDVFDPMRVSVVHCINRAVRRAMLCGVDKFSGKSYEHRRDWIKKRLEFLAGCYGIDVLGYAVMGNHMHVILRNRPDVVEMWSDEDVARRIWRLFPKRKDQAGNAEEPHDHELKMLIASKRQLAEYRRRLSDVSWLMRQLAEKVARLANKEDECSGRFWEGRFKCQPLLDDAAILACAAYVDLNPVRAGIAQTPEESDYTSVQDRIVAAKQPAKAAKADAWLAPVHLNERSAPGPKASKSRRRASDKGFLPIRLGDYLQLLDWTGREIVCGKRGRIPNSCKPILERLQMSRLTWCELVRDFGKLFRSVAGNRGSLQESATRAGKRHRQSAGGAALLTGR